MSCIAKSPACSYLLDPRPRWNSVISRGSSSIPGFLLQQLEFAMELRTKKHLVPLVQQKITWLCRFVDTRRSGRMPVSRPIIIFKGCVWVWSRHQLGGTTSVVLDSGGIWGVWSQHRSHGKEVTQMRRVLQVVLTGCKKHCKEVSSWSCRKV